MREQQKVVSVGGALVNEFDDLLPYTVESTIQGSREKCIDMWGEEAVDSILKRGGRFVQVEIREV